MHLAPGWYGFRYGFQPSSAYDMVTAAEKFAADEDTAEGFTGDLADNKHDAMRHAYWNAMMTRVLGDARAEIWANAHEWGKPSTGLSVQMDLANNAAGREVGINMRRAKSSQMQAVVRGMANGEPRQRQICTTTPCS